LALGQVWYTWARDGLEGVNRFQIVASSEPLEGRTRAFVEQARTFCRYSPPDGASARSAPVSFGWSDVGTTRFAFCRTYLGEDATGRPGNFAAHVLFGRMPQLQIPALLASFGSSLWWAGQMSAVPPDGRLERVADLPPGHRRPDTQDPAILAGAFAGCCNGGPIHTPPSPLVAAISSIAEILSELVDVGAFSSFEPDGPRATEDYFTYGSGAACPDGPAHAALTDSRHARSLHTAAAFLADPGHGHAALRTAWADTARSRDRIPDWVQLIDALGATVTARIDWSRAIPALLGPSTANVLLDTPAVQRSLAEQLIQGNEELVQMLILVAERLSSDILIGLGEALADVGLHDEPAAAHVWRLAQGLPTELRQALLRAALVTLQRKPTAARAWPGEMILALARTTSSSAVGKEAEGELIRLIAPLGQLLLDDRTADPTLRAKVFLSDEGRGRLELSPRLLARDLPFSAALVRQDTDQRVFELFDVARPAVVFDLLASFGTTLEQHKAVLLLQRAVARTASQDAVRELNRLAASTHGREVLRESGVVAPTCENLIRTYLRDERLQIELPTLVGLCAGRAPEWHDLFLRLLHHDRHEARRDLRAQPFAPTNVGKLGTALEFVEYLREAGSVDDVGWLVHWYRVACPDLPLWRLCQQLLTAADRASRFQYAEKAAVRALLYVALVLVGDGLLQPGSVPLVEARRIDRQAATLWARLGASGSWERLEGEVEVLRGSRRAKTWLRSLGRVGPARR
jgi:hypothetical protein